MRHFHTEMGQGNPLRIPAPLRHDVEQIVRLTDPFCGEHLDAEYAELVRTLMAKLARKRRSSPFAHGDLRIWAEAAICAVGSVNVLFDRTPRPHLTGDDLSALTGVPKSTFANKAVLIRDVLRIGSWSRSSAGVNCSRRTRWPGCSRSTGPSWTRARCRPRSRRRLGGVVRSLIFQAPGANDDGETAGGGEER